MLPRLDKRDPGPLPEVRHDFLCEELHALLRASVRQAAKSELADECSKTDLILLTKDLLQHRFGAPSYVHPRFKQLVVAHLGEEEPARPEELPTNALFHL